MPRAGGGDLAAAVALWEVLKYYQEKRLLGREVKTVKSWSRQNECSTTVFGREPLTGRLWTPISNVKTTKSRCFIRFQIHVSHGWSPPIEHASE